MKNITYIISDVQKSFAFEWIINHINKEQINLSFILINSKNSELENYIRNNGLNVYHIKVTKKPDFIFAILKCVFYLIKLKSHGVHCHMFQANLVGLISAKILRLKKRIYTRHHSDYHLIYYPKIVKFDKLCNKLATKIVSITDVVTEILINDESVPIEKIEKIWHGFNTSVFTDVNPSKVHEMREKYIPKDKDFIVGVISRAEHWKGIQYIIPAFQDFLKENKNAYLLLLNCHGIYMNQINELLKELPENSYCKIEFESEINHVYQLFDVFVHVPISKSVEAFGQVYIETILAKIPMIATKSGIGNDILINQVNCYEVPYENSKEIFNGLIKIKNDQNFAHSITTYSFEETKNAFSINKMIDSLEKLYV